MAAQEMKKLSIYNAMKFIIQYFLLMRIVLFPDTIQGAQIGQVENLLISQKIPYIIKDYNTFLISNLENVHLNITLKDGSISDQLQFTEIRELNLIIILNNVNLIGQNSNFICGSSLTSLIINQVELRNVISTKQLLNATLESCNSTTIQQITLMNFFSTQSLFLLTKVPQLNINNFISDQESIQLSKLPIFQIIHQNITSKIIVNNISISTTSTLSINNENSKSEKDDKSKQLQQALLVDTNYDSEQRSFIQISQDPVEQSLVSQGFQFINMTNIVFAINKGNIRFIETINLQSSTTFIEQGFFQRNRAIKNGGSIYMEGSSHLYISNTIFDQCSSEYFGGAIMTLGINETKNVTFSNCISKIGGAVFINIVYSYIDMKEVNFINNTALVASPDIFYCQHPDGKSWACDLFDVDQILEYNPQFQSNELYLVDTQYEYKKLGAPDRDYLQSNLLFGQIYVIKLKIQFAKINITTFNENQQFGNLYNYLSQDTMQNFFPISIPNVTFPYLVTAYTQAQDCSETDTLYLYKLDYFNQIYTGTQIIGCFNITSECNQGMSKYNTIAYQQIYTSCQYCGYGTFTYESQKNCIPCNPEMYQYCYSNITAVNYGYWRKEYSQKEESIYQCYLSPSNCKSSNREGVGNTLCAEGYMNEQCLTCDLNGQIWGNEAYGLSGQFQCIKCSSLNNNNAYFILSISLQLLLFGLTLYSNQNRMKNQVYRKYLSKLQIIYIGSSFIRQSQTSVYIKILLFNFQIYLTAYYILNFNQSDHSFHSTAFSFFNPFQSQGNNSYDCFLKNLFPSSESIGYVKLQIASYTPLIINVFVLIVTLIIILIKKQRIVTLLYLMVHCFSYTILFLFQSSILQYSIQSLKCLSLTNESDYLLLDTSINCEDTSKTHQIKMLGIISIVVFIVLIPLGLFFLLFRQRQNLENSKVICLYGFLFDEYKRKYYYWQFLKILLSVFLTFLLQEMRTQSMLAIIIYITILTLYLISVFLLMPFQSNPLNMIEIVSVTLSILYLLASISIQLSYSTNQSYESNQVSSFLANFFYYTILAFLAIFYTYMVVLIITSFFHTSIQKLQRYRLFIYFSRKFPTILSKLYSKQLRDNFKIFRMNVKDVIQQVYQHKISPPTNEAIQDLIEYSEQEIESEDVEEKQISIQ